MRAVQLDFVPRRPAWPAWVLLAIGMVLAGDAGLRYLDLREQARQLQQRPTVPRPSAAPQSPALSEPARRELDAARQILQELALPWEPLFQSIEGAIRRDTALLAIEPDAGKGRVQIRGEARDYLAVLAFMRRLEAPQVLTGVHLLSHEIREDVAERPYLFTLAASWRAAP